MTIASELEILLFRLALPPSAGELLRGHFAESVNLIRAGEEGIGLENLCDNLYDFSVPLNPADRDLIAALCVRYHVGAHRIRLLDTLVGAR